MNLKGKAKARATGYVKRETQAKQNDGMTALVELSIVSTEKQASKLYGEDFAAFAFSDTETIDGEVVHRFADKKPSADFKPENHAVTINGVEVIVKPRLGRVFPVAQTEKVLTKVVLPVYIAPASKLGAQLERISGQDVEVSFSETQKSLPFEDDGDEGGE